MILCDPTCYTGVWLRGPTRPDGLVTENTHGAANLGCDMNLADTKLVFIDLETTGLVVCQGTSRPKLARQLINPERPIPVEVHAVVESVTGDNGARK